MRFAILRVVDHGFVAEIDLQNQAAADAYAATHGVVLERLNGAETKPNDLLLVVPATSTIEYPPPVLPPKVVAVKNRGEVATLRQRRGNGQSITYPVRIDLRDGGVLVIATESELDTILAASA